MTTYCRMLIRRLARQGITAEIVGTGGNCTAVVIPLNGAEILVTNGDADLPTSDNVLATLTLEGEDEPVFLAEQSPAPVRDVLEIVSGWVAVWSLDK